MNFAGSISVRSCNKKNAVRQKPAREQGRIIALAHARASVQASFCYMTLCSNKNIKHFDRLNRTTTKSALKRQIRFMFIIFYNLSGNARLYL